ncbi:MAG: hypothetical protein QM817_12245 [Archangium sp.]
MTREEAKTISDAAVAAEGDAAWAALEPLKQAAQTEALAARWYGYTLSNLNAPRDARIAEADRLVTQWKDDAALVITLGNEIEGMVDLRFLNAAPAASPYFENLFAQLARHYELRGEDHEGVRGALATVARIRGRAADALGDRLFRELVAQSDGNDHAYHYGLFLKTRGRFAEAVEFNRRALAAGFDTEAVKWNLGICATGAGDGATALEAWRMLGMKVELGADGLPIASPRFLSVKVRLAERPLAARDATNDEPGNEETVWIDRLSPCHGMVINATASAVGADYGTLVLFDGAAIGFQTWNGQQVPVFPQLTVLRPSRHRVFEFVGSQKEKNTLAKLGPQLPGDSMIEALTESMYFLCKACADGGHAPHTHDETKGIGVVRGKICIDPTVDLKACAAKLRELVAALPEAAFHSPQLARAIGDERLAIAEERAVAQLSR